MKIIDTRKGKIFGISLLDVIIIAVVIFLIFSFTSKVTKDKLEFSGNEMYNAIQTYTNLDSKGFLIEAKVEGKWIRNGSPFNGKGIIISAVRGGFRVRNAEGKVLSVGGEMAYSEDIAATKIVFNPIYRCSVPINLEYHEFDSYNGMISYFEELMSEYKADDLFLTCDISFIGSNKSAQEILNEFSDIYHTKYIGFVQISDEEKIVRIILTSLSELKEINIEAKKVIIAPVGFASLSSFAVYKERTGDSCVCVEDVL